MRVRKAAKELKAKRRLPTQPERNRAVFWPDHMDEVKAIAMSGATDDEMAALMNIKPELLEAWRQYYPLFEEAIEAGRTHADAQVVAALHANATGFEYETDEVVRTRRGAQVITVKKKFLPETNAQKFWLQNRSPRWRQSQNVNVGGQGPDKPVHVKSETKQEVIHSILNLISPQPDNP